MNTILLIVEIALVVAVYWATFGGTYKGNRALLIRGLIIAGGIFTIIVFQNNKRQGDIINNRIQAHYDTIMTTIQDKYAALQDSVNVLTMNQRALPSLITAATVTSANDVEFPPSTVQKDNSLQRFALRPELTILPVAQSDLKRQDSMSAVLHRICPADAYNIFLSLKNVGKSTAVIDSAFWGYIWRTKYMEEHRLPLEWFLTPGALEVQVIDLIIDTLSIIQFQLTAYYRWQDISVSDEKFALTKTYEMKYINGRWSIYTADRGSYLTQVARIPIANRINISNKPSEIELLYWLLKN
ncbi:MAG: hypothetical protein NT002_02430 [candidate division Zixibacteria bacterium]|nr:hypothetical protein [candidate division Zixibacteria bacterium]